MTTKNGSPLPRTAILGEENKNQSRVTLSSIYHTAQQPSTFLHYCGGCGRCFKTIHQYSYLCNECIQFHQHEVL